MTRTMRRLGLALSTAAFAALLGAAPAVSADPVPAEPTASEPAPAPATADHPPYPGESDHRGRSERAPSPSCPGALIDTYRVHGPYARGVVYLYYSRAGGGTNCAWFQRTNSPGRRIYMYVHLMRCPRGARPGGYCRPDMSAFDGGHYRYYAGPVRLTGTSRHCIRIAAGDARGTVLFTRNHHCR